MWWCSLDTVSHCCGRRLDPSVLTLLFTAAADADWDCALSTSTLVVARAVFDVLDFCVPLDRLQRPTDATLAGTVASVYDLAPRASAGATWSSTNVHMAVAVAVVAARKPLNHRRTRSLDCSLHRARWSAGVTIPPRSSTCVT